MRFSIRDLMWATVVVAMGLGLGSCRPVDIKSYQATHKHGLTVIREAKEIEALLGDADHFITHFGFGSGKTNTWNSEVYFGGRYCLTMQVEIEIDYSNSRVTNIVGEPQFWLKVYESFSRVPNGNMSARTAQDIKFGRKEWQKVLESKGDFSAVGVERQKGTGLTGFEEFVRAMRAPRIKIEH
jgi:hypothetical protein